MSGTDPYWGGEQVVLCRDEIHGLRAVIAIDDTTLGPGLGGVRLARYPDLATGAVEARRLAAAMTVKNALAGLPYGGAKSVIFVPDPGTDRQALMHRFGEFVARTGGAYVPGVDMGTGPDDLSAIASAGATVSCAAEDPSPWTAAGTFAAIEAAVRHVTQGALAGVRVLVQGVGNVGARLAGLLAEAGAHVLVADVDDARAAATARAVNGGVVRLDSLYTADVDVFAPCANARVLDAGAAGVLSARIVAGAANDILADDPTAEVLAERGITYVPDFVVNAGGVIQIHALQEAWTEDRLRSAVNGIGDRVGEILEAARGSDRSPLHIARALAYDVLRGAREGRPGTEFVSR